MTEVWKSIPGFDGFYEASSCGGVRSVRRQTRGVSKAGTEFLKWQGGERLKMVDHSAGYASVVLSAAGVRSGRLVHRLIAEAFIPNPSGHPWINHIDGNKKNNAVGNLEWCTPTHNSQHAIALGLFRTLRGEQRSAAKLSDAKVRVIRDLLMLGFGNDKIGEFFGVSSAVISNIRTGHAWAHIDQKAA